MKVRFNDLNNSVYELETINIINHFPGTGTAYYLQINAGYNDKRHYLDYGQDNIDKCFSDVEKIFDLQNKSGDITKL
jgi:hypothetical protein